MTDQHLLSTKNARKHRRRWSYGLLLVGIVVVGGLGWGLLSRAASIRLYVIPSGSMSPAILPGDRVTVELGASEPRRQELWIFQMPAKNGVPGGEAIKRVIGLPGETIAIENGKVVIDGKPLDEPYLSLPMTYTMASLTLSESQYFLMGDQRNASADSHVFGPVPSSGLTGRVLYRVWPLDRAGALNK